MLKSFKRFFCGAVSAAVIFVAAAPQASAGTEAKQFQFSGGTGVFAATDDMGAAFAFFMEPEYFFTEHVSLSFRLDSTIGHTDSLGVGTRFRYYFNFEQHPNLSIYVGAGVGWNANFESGQHGIESGNFGDLALPVFGWQYDLGEHFKIGSDMSFDVLFDDDEVAVGGRIMPLVMKWAF